MGTLANLDRHVSKALIRERGVRDADVGCRTPPGSRHKVRADTGDEFTASEPHRPVSHEDATM